MGTNRKRTQSGRFEVNRGSSDCIWLWNIPNDVSAGRFSHLRVQTYREALEGVERAEARLTPEQLALIDLPRDLENTAQTAALVALGEALTAEFPNGGWSRG